MCGDFCGQYAGWLNRTYELLEGIVALPADPPELSASGRTTNFLKFCQLWHCVHHFRKAMFLPICTQSMWRGRLSFTMRPRFRPRTECPLDWMKTSSEPRP